MLKRKKGKEKSPTIDVRTASIFFKLALHTDHPAQYHVVTDRQRQTEIETETKMDRNRQKQTETDRNRQKQRET